jgi:hypothetical protein
MWFVAVGLVGIVFGVAEWSVVASVPPGPKHYSVTYVPKHVDYRPFPGYEPQHGPCTQFRPIVQTPPECFLISP